MIIKDLQTIISNEAGCTLAAAHKAASAINFKYRGLFNKNFSDDPVGRAEVIRELYKTGATIEELAKQYRMYPETVKRMVKVDE